MFELFFDVLFYLLLWWSFLMCLTNWLLWVM